MAEIKMLPLDKIMVPERLRDVQEDHAFMIGQSIARIGLLNPITVRATPRGQRPYTLVAGAHRLHGSGLAGLKEIATIVVKADQAEAQMVEIEENVFRNDLSKLDRAVCVHTLPRVVGRAKWHHRPEGRQAKGAGKLPQLDGDFRRQRPRSVLPACRRADGPLQSGDRACPADRSQHHP